MAPVAPEIPTISGRDMPDPLQEPRAHNKTAGPYTEIIFQTRQTLSQVLRIGTVIRAPMIDHEIEWTGEKRYKTGCWESDPF